MPEPTVTVAPVRSDDPKKKKEENATGDKKDTSKPGEKEGEGEELVSKLVLMANLYLLNYAVRGRFNS